MTQPSRERYRSAARRQDPPSEYGWSSRRRWRKDDRARVRAEKAGEVRGWRDRDSVDAAGPVVAIVAVVIAALLWFTGGDDDTDTPTSVGQTSAPSNDTPATVAPSASVAPPGELPGSDAPVPIAPEPFATGPGGDVAHRFLLAWNQYVPNLPDPTGQWIATWADDADDPVERYAEAAAPALWTAAVTDGITVTDPVVQAGGTLAEGAGQAVYEADVVRRLFPVGAAPGTPDTTETVRMRVVLTEDAGTWTVVSTQVLTGAAEVDTPAGAGE